MKSNDENTKKKIGLRIQTLRKQAGMTAGDLVSITGIGLSTLQNYEAGLRQTPLAAIMKIARALKASAPYIACLTDDPMHDMPAEQPTPSGFAVIPNDLSSPDTAPLLAINRDILKSKNIDPAKLSVIQNYDELMAPTIQIADHVVIDNSVNTIAAAGIYALEDEHGLTILRHCRAIPGDNTVTLSTQKEAEKNTSYIPVEQFERYRVVGRVVSIINWL